jgi:hypothetical protein
MRALGCSETQVLAAWDQARAAGFTESTGLGQDGLTEKGRARVHELRWSRDCSNRWASQVRLTIGPRSAG